MTPEQSKCTALLKLGDDGIWFCPKCGLRVALPKKRTKRGRRAAVQDCADRSGPYSNPID
jgi:ribosomal protein L37AE/L43A